MEAERAKPKSRFLGRRELKMTLQMSVEEAHIIQTRAKAVGMKLSPYMRQQLLGSSDLSRETSLVLAELGRVRELMTRLWSAASEGELDLQRVAEIAHGIDAIEGRVLVARAVRGKP